MTDPKTLTGTSRLAGVFGWPVTHSRSPRLHGYWLAEHGIDGAYVPLAVEPLDFPQSVRALAKSGFQGANVTVPHKEKAYTLCKTVDDFARRTGAVNTLVFQPAGSIHGMNTDGFGFIENIRQSADLSVSGFSFGRGPAVVLGAGGASRAVLVALADAGVPEIRLSNRTRARAEEMVAQLDLRCRIYDWADRAAALEDAALLVNTTILGMTGAAALDLTLARLPGDALVTDLVYTPLQTSLLSDAAARGNPAVDGLGMLLHQARPGFQAWFGPDPQVTDALRAFVAADLISTPAGGRA